MKSILLAVISSALTIIGLPVTRFLVSKWRLERRNFKGKMVPAGFGVLIVVAAVPAYVGFLIHSGFSARTCMFLAAVVGFGIIGLIDDVYGTRQAGGFGGHLRMLFQGRITTGLMKAAIGGVLALVIGLWASGFHVALGVMNGLIVALFANLLNLLDLRPGRAASCFWIGIVVFAAARLGRLSEWRELIPVLVAAAVLTVLDRSARVMLGDAGSNVLGAVLGLLAVFELGVAAKIVVLVALIWVHLYAEKKSLSTLIERTPTLRRLDGLMGDR